MNITYLGTRQTELCHHPVPIRTSLNQPTKFKAFYCPLRWLHITSPEFMSAFKISTQLNYRSDLMAKAVCPIKSIFSCLVFLCLLPLLAIWLDASVCFVPMSQLLFVVWLVNSVFQLHHRYSEDAKKDEMTKFWIQNMIRWRIFSYKSPE